MKNIHVLPTDKNPIKGDLLLRHLWRGTSNECISWWRYNETITIDDVIQYTTLNGSFRDITSSFKTHNIYITNNEEIKEGDSVILKSGRLTKAEISQGVLGFKTIDGVAFLYFQEGDKKVILTTDQDLIKQGIQSIPDDFLEWFVKNPSCKSVEVKFNNRGITGAEKILKTFGEYKIIIPRTTQQIINEDYAGGLEMGQIIPKEEPKQDCFLLPDCTCKEPDFDVMKGLCKICGNSIIHLGKRIKVNKQETLEEVAERLFPINTGDESLDYQNKVRKPNWIAGAKWQQEQNELGNLPKRFEHENDTQYKLRCYTWLNNKF